MTNTIFYNNTENASLHGIEKYDSYKGTVVKRMPNGCIIKLNFENEDMIYAFTYGAYTRGDQVLVSVTKIIHDTGYLRVSVDSVLRYAFDNSNIHRLQTAA